MKKVFLCILDGFSLGDPSYKYNAFAQANCPYIHHLLKTYPNSKIQTSGLAVGLPEGQMGNSEVGHMTIGSGRIIYQDLVKISKAIQNGTIWQHQTIIQTINYLQQNPQYSLHLLGLISEGGVHSHANHTLAIANHFATQGCNVKLHLISDGRDVPPQSFKAYLQSIFMPALHPKIEVSTVSGRYYAMDRDNKLDRTQAAFEAICNANAPKYTDIYSQIDTFYNSGITDEFFTPIAHSSYLGCKPQDIMFMTNFRSDRTRQIFETLIDRFKTCISMTHYAKCFDGRCQALFTKDKIINTLPQIVANNNLKQLHISETEKYAHVTFFFNGGKEQPEPNETRIMIPSPNVQTYDLQPEMSINELKTTLAKAITETNYDLIVCNIANGDMVGHTGNFEAAKKAVEAIDNFLSHIIPQALHTNYHTLITADHGNIEEMIDKHTNQLHTQHTTGPVPLISISNNPHHQLQNGTLADIAPTILSLMQIPQPLEMTGINLIIQQK